MPPKQTPNDFIRVSAELFDSPKLADLADQHGLVIYGAWVQVMVMAKRAKRLGRVMLNPVRFARLTGLSVDEATTLLGALERVRSIVPVGDKDHHFQVRNWAKWQSMAPAERTRKHRAQDATGGCVYAIAGGGRIKIGHTTMSPETRMAQLQVGSPVPLSVVWHTSGSKIDEATLHDRLREYAESGEWFVDCSAVREVLDRFSSVTNTSLRVTETVTETPTDVTEQSIGIDTTPHHTTPQDTTPSIGIPESAPTPAAPSRVEVPPHYIAKALDWVRRKHPPMSHHVYDRCVEIMRDMVDDGDPPRSLKWWTTRGPSGLSRAERAFAMVLEEGAKHSVDSVNRIKEREAEQATEDADYLASLVAEAQEATT